MKPMDVSSGMTGRVFLVRDHSLLRDWCSEMDLYIIKVWVSVKDSFTMSYKHAVTDDHKCKALQKPHPLRITNLIKTSMAISGAHEPLKK